MVMRRRFRFSPSPRWVWPGLLATTIVIASGQSSVAGPDFIDFDKLAHFSIFGLLATLIARTPWGGRAVWLAILATSLFGGTDELHQSLTPGRSVEVADWVADTLGAIVAVTVYWHWGWYRRWMERPLWQKRTVEKRAISTPNLVT